MKAIGYVRVSSEGQAANGISLDMQTEKIAAYCEANGFELAGVLRDEGISGGRRERFDRMFAAAKKAGAGAVVVYHFDRFGRDLSGVLDTLTAWARRGLELHAVGKGRIENETASGFLSAAVEGMVSEHYRRIISEKTKDAKSRNRRDGLFNGGVVPFGYRLAEDGRTLTPDAGEQEAVGLILSLRADGLSLRAIAARLNAEGYRTKAGRDWKAVQVSNTIRTAEYLAA